MASDITIVGLTALPGPSQVTLSWGVSDPHEDGLTYLQFDVAEIWRSFSPTMAGAVKVAESYTAWTDTAARVGRLRYYRVRARDRLGQVGEFSSVVVSRDNSEVFIATTAGVASYLVLASGIVFQWGSATTDSNAEATAIFNQGPARFIPYFTRCIQSLPGDDRYTPGYTQLYEVRFPQLKSMTVLGGVGVSAVFQCRRAFRLRGGGLLQRIKVDPYRQLQQGGVPVPDTPGAQAVGWVAIGVRV